MSLFHLVILALLQGVTEFLPVSSSGHLALLPALTDLPDQGLALDVAVHVGTLVAVVLYFRADVVALLRGAGHLISGRYASKEAGLAALLAIATVPVVLAGLALSLSGLSEAVRSVAVIGWTTLIFGVVLWWADRNEATEKKVSDWNFPDALKMGCAQALALIPGTSRSGITISAARRLGYGREEATRLAMLMSIPTILASGSLLGFEAVAEMDRDLLVDAAVAAALACIAALVALSVMIKLLRHVSFAPYAAYRIVLGLGLLAYAYS